MSSIISQIEYALKVCNGDKFANLSRIYLSYRFPNVHSSGFALGKEESKSGTPDNFIPYEDYYIFNEITAQSKGLLEKLKKDIQHCFKSKGYCKGKNSKNYTNM